MELIKTKELYKMTHLLLLRRNLRTAKPKSEYRKLRWDLKTI